MKLDVVGILRTANEDVRSLRELIVYGLKGMVCLYWTCNEFRI